MHLDVANQIFFATVDKLRQICRSGVQLEILEQFIIRLKASDKLFMVNGRTGEIIYQQCLNALSVPTYSERILITIVGHKAFVNPRFIEQEAFKQHKRKQVAVYIGIMGIELSKVNGLLRLMMENLIISSDWHKLVRATIDHIAHYCQQEQTCPDKRFYYKLDGMCGKHVTIFDASHVWDQGTLVEFEEPFCGIAKVTVQGLCIVTCQLIRSYFIKSDDIFVNEML